MGEKAGADQDDGQAGAAPPDGVQYCSEHPYRRSGAAVAGGGICAFCLQEKLGRLVSSSKSSTFFPLGGHPPPSASPPSFRRADEPPPRLRASRRFIPFHRKKTSSSTASATLSASMAGGGLKRTKSVAPRPEEQFPYSVSSLTADSPRKKGFWSFLYLSSAYAQQTAASTPYANGSAAAARRKSLSVASASADRAAGGGAATGAAAQDQQPRAGTSTLEAIGEPESPSQASFSIGRKVSRSRSVGCGSRSFSGDFLERLSNGFGDCTLRRAESHREPKPDKARRGGLGRLGADDDDGVYVHQHGMNMKCAGFFGGLGPAMPSYWLSAGGGVGGGRIPRRSWAWALASPVRALRPTRGSTSTKTITAVCTTSTSSLSISSPTQSSSEPTAEAEALAATN